MTLNVIWHKIPDTDSVVSAIVAASYFNKLWIEATACILGEINNETRFLLEYAGEASPKLIESLPWWSIVCLVDHNENSQTIDNIWDLKLFWIIDHHKFWWLSTSNPMYVRTEPLCSTASIVYKIMKENNIEISKSEAILLIWAIISDSLYFRSPTSTDEDKNIILNLNEIAKIHNLEEFSLKLFEAKSDLWDISAHDLVKVDFKEFEVNWNKLWIWVIETTNPSYSLNRKEELLKAMEEIKLSTSLNYILLSVVDILDEKNTTFVLSEKEIDLVKSVFGIDTKDNIANLWKVLSRKKQIIPQITDYLSK